MKFIVIISAPEELQENLRKAVGLHRMLSIVSVTQVVVAGRIVTTIQYSNGYRD